MRPVVIPVLFLVLVLLSAACTQPAAETGKNIPASVSPEGTASVPPSPASSLQDTGAGQVTATPFSGKFIDTHAHIRPSSMAYPEILRLMDEHGIDRMIVMEPPGDIWISRIQPSVYGVPEAARQNPDRFCVLYSGEAGALLYETVKTGTNTPEQEQRFRKLLDDALSSGTYRGIGEIGLRHQPPPGMPATYDITVPADHPWMFIMSDTAAKFQVPLDVHLQAGLTDTAAFERLLDHNRETIVIWDHAGDHTQNVDPGTLRTLMTAHPNLYSSIKVRTTEKQPQGAIVRKDGKLDPEWKQLITDFPDRFIVGTDVKLGIRPDEIRFVDDHTTLLNQLPPDVARKVAQENPKRIFRL